MKRDLLKSLKQWKIESKRKPVLLRGARQVGKSYLVKEFGGEFFNFVEINFEFEPSIREIFQKDLDPARIIRDLALMMKVDIHPGKTLLFLDEIQECEEAVKSLRYFYEKLPQMHVIAAGSLLDFVLDETGIPVGRIMPLYLYPMSFMEFLSANGNQNFREFIEIHNPDEKIPEYLHDKLLILWGEYMAVGGMPEAVQEWIDSGDFRKCSRIHQMLIDTYRQDFQKYAKKNQQKYVEMVFNAIPRLSGKKFVFSHVSQDLRTRELNPALSLLEKAGIAHPVYHSSSNGIPLGAEINPKVRKIIFLDIALSQCVLGIDYSGWIVNPEKFISNAGAVSEAFVGQEIAAYSMNTRKNDLYYWTREKRGSMAEVDYVVVSGGEIVPVEVKSGITGSIKSMYLFLNSKANSGFGIQLSKKNFGIKENIRQYPLYAVSRIFM